MNDDEVLIDDPLVPIPEGEGTIKLHIKYGGKAMSENRKQLIRQAKEMYPELFAEMQEGLQESLKELVQPNEGEDKAHTTHEKIVAEMQAELDRQAKAISAAIDKLEGPGMPDRAREAIQILTEAVDED